LTPNSATSSFELPSGKILQREEWPDAREFLESFSLNRRIDVHHRQLSLHESGELHGMGERRRVRGGEISGMKNPPKWEHRCVDRRTGS
jgi:hypothetical protein